MCFQVCLGAPHQGQQELSWMPACSKTLWFQTPKEAMRLASTRSWCSSPPRKESRTLLSRPPLLASAGRLASSLLCLPAAASWKQRGLKC
eukprot:11202576-Alexandrium_andersonii.AAC.1